MKKTALILTILVLCVAVNAQNNNFEMNNNSPTTVKPSKTQFMVRGYGHTGLNSLKSKEEKESSFVGSAFAPIFLFKHSDKLMFEAELEFVLEGNELEVGLEYADVMYVVNKNLTLRAGKFLLPFGTFMERLHPAWINRLPTRPLGFGHDGIAPASGIGFEIRGAFDLGGPKLNYSAYATNGPRLKDGSIEPEEAGLLSFNNYEDNNNSKAFGGRLGFLPFSDSSAEIGFSGYTTNGVGKKDSAYENVGAFLYAIDFSFVKQIPALNGIIDIKGQYNNSKVDNAFYVEMHEDGDEEEYTFNNRSNSFYTQLSYRPTMADSDFLKKIELVGRFSNFNAPEGAEWEEQSDQYAFSVNYWMSWRSVVKIAYQTTNSIGGHDGGGTINGLFIHWAIGL